MSRIYEILLTKDLNLVIIGKNFWYEQNDIVGVSCSPDYAIIWDLEDRIFGFGKLPNQMDVSFQKFTKIPIFLKKIKRIRDIKCGYDHCVVLADSIYGIGSSLFGQLGLKSRNSSNYFEEIFVGDADLIQCGPKSTVIKMKNGEIFACGLNENQQLTEKNTCLMEFQKIGEDKNLTEIKIGISFVLFRSTNSTELRSTNLIQIPEKISPNSQISVKQDEILICDGQKSVIYGSDIISVCCSENSTELTEGNRIIVPKWSPKKSYLYTNFFMSKMKMLLFCLKESQIKVPKYLIWMIFFQVPDFR